MAFGSEVPITEKLPAQPKAVKTAPVAAAASPRIVFASKPTQRDAWRRGQALTGQDEQPISNRALDDADQLSLACQVPIMARNGVAIPVMCSIDALAAEGRG